MSALPNPAANPTAHNDTVLNLFSVIVRTLEQRKRWNLRSREDRADFERRAYFPRLDYGDQPDLRPGYHVEGDEGWMD